MKKNIILLLLMIISVCLCSCKESKTCVKVKYVEETKIEQKYFSVKYLIIFDENGKEIRRIKDVYEYSYNDEHCLIVILNRKNGQMSLMYYQPKFNEIKKICDITNPWTISDDSNYFVFSNYNKNIGILELYSFKKDICKTDLDLRILFKNKPYKSVPNLNYFFYTNTLKIDYYDGWDEVFESFVIDLEDNYKITRLDINYSKNNPENCNNLPVLH